jgi:hypothetical protein
MNTDRQGLEMTGSAGAVEAYDRAVDLQVRFRPEVTDAIAAVVAADPGCVMGRVAGAYLGLMSTEAHAVAEAREALGPFAHDGDEGLLPRERAHLAAARRWAGGDMAGAGALLSDISIRYPRDLLALAVGHQIDFFRGDAVTLRDRVGRALGAWTRTDQLSGFVYGMYAFGLEECNQYGQSAEAGQRAVEANPDDVWGIHAVAHTFEMRGQIPDGVRFMRSRQRDWTRDNFLNVHNSWHFALYLLQADDVAGALAIYDSVLNHAGSGDVAMELLDSSALLWRMQLEGVPVGDRWRPLAEAWTRLLVPGFYPFNDMHAIMAYIGTGELNRARELVAALDRVVREGDQAATGWTMTSAVGLPVCRSLVLFAEGAYELVLSELMPIRTRVHEFGGSHAQRDAVERTLLEAAIRSGRTDLANALVSERLANRECNTYAWSKRALLLAAAGNQDGAESAAARERELAGQIRSAAEGFSL